MDNVLVENNLVNNIDWKEFMDKSLFSTPFQSPEFLEFFNTVPGQSARVFALEKQNEPVALCVVTVQKEKGIKGFFSKRAIIYGGPIFIENDLQACNELLKLISNKLHKEVIYIETRNFNNYQFFQPNFFNENWKYLDYLNFQVDLQNTNLEELVGKMKYNRKREIRLSFEEKAIYEQAQDINEVNDLYIILNDLYKNRVKLPLPEFNYFEKLFQSSIGKVFVVKHNNSIIGGSFCFYYPGKNIYTLYYCGLRDYHKKIFPTHLAILAAMEFGINNGLKKLDLMGAGQPGKEYGVRKYKAEFGGLQVEHGRYIKICKPLLYNIGKLGLSILKKTS